MNYFKETVAALAGESKGPSAMGLSDASAVFSAGRDFRRRRHRGRPWGARVRDFILHWSSSQRMALGSGDQREVNSRV